MAPPLDCSRIDGGDYPDPLAACPGYTAPTGAPISIQLGEGYGPDGSLEVESDSVTRDGVEIETCLITAASYSGGNADQTELGKYGLVRIGAAVIIPREPLAPGHYQVALKEAGKLYQWRFTVAAACCACSIDESLAGSNLASGISNAKAASATANAAAIATR